MVNVDVYLKNRLPTIKDEVYSTIDVAEFVVMASPVVPQGVLLAEEGASIKGNLVCIYENSYCLFISTSSVWVVVAILKQLHVVGC